MKCYNYYNILTIMMEKKTLDELVRYVKSKMLNYSVKSIDKEQHTINLFNKNKTVKLELNYSGNNNCYYVGFEGVKQNHRFTGEFNILSRKKRTDNKHLQLFILLQNQF